MFFTYGETIYTLTFQDKLLKSIWFVKYFVNLILRINPKYNICIFVWISFIYGNATHKFVIKNLMIKLVKDKYDLFLALL